MTTVTVTLAFSVADEGLLRQRVRELQEYAEVDLCDPFEDPADYLAEIVVTHLDLFGQAVAERESLAVVSEGDPAHVFEDLDGTGWLAFGLERTDLPS